MAFTIVALVTLSFATTGYYLWVHSQLTDWFNRSSSVSLTGLKLHSHGSVIVVTNLGALKSLDAGIKRARYASAPFAYPCDAYPQINGTWCGQVVFSINHTSVIVGIPSSANPFELEYEYCKFDIDKTAAEMLEQLLRDTAAGKTR